MPPEKQRLTPVSRNGLERAVKGVARRAGVKNWRDVTPKSLRKAFESALRNNRLDPKDQEFARASFGYGGRVQAPAHNY